MRPGYFAPTCFCLLLLADCKDESAQRRSSGRATAQAVASAVGMQSAGASEVASAVAIASAAATQSQKSVAGSVHSVGGALGTWEIALSDCQSGEVNGFYGADFYAPGSTDLRLRYVHDEAKGEIVKIIYPTKKDTALVLEPHDCKVLEGSVQKTNFKTWTPKGDIRHVNGHVKFDCKHTGGKGHVTGEATFSHCH